VTSRRSFFAKCAAAIGAAILTPFAAKVSAKPAGQFVSGWDIGASSNVSTIYFIGPDGVIDVARYAGSAEQIISLWEEKHQITWDSSYHITDRNGH